MWWLRSLVHNKIFAKVIASEESLRVSLSGLLSRGIDVAAQRAEVVPLSTTDTALSLSISSARSEEVRTWDMISRRDLCWNEINVVAIVLGKNPEQWYPQNN